MLRQLVLALLPAAMMASAAAQWPAAPAPPFTARALTEGNRFTKNAEGPEFTRSGRLFVVNCERDGTVCEVFPDGRVEVFVTLPAGSTANAIRETSTGALMLADFSGHNVLRLDPATRAVTVHAHDDRFNQPNDLAIRKDDVLFASDPKWADGTGQLWRIDPDGQATRLLEGLGTTNGLALSPDERLLYVAESVQRRIWVYDVDARGNVSGKRRFADFPDFGLDGIKCDAGGRLFVTRHGKGTIAILRRDGSAEREVAVGGREVSNLVFGGRDGRIVFVTLQDRRSMEWFGSDTPGARWTR
jgi:sugar lactone lactonase YvrE